MTTRAAAGTGSEEVGGEEERTRIGGTARRRLRIGHVWIDHLTRPEALDALARLVARGKGGAVFTPNVDHIVTAERDERLRGAYRRADLALADGVPVLWAARLLGAPLPEKLSGSDLIEPIVELAARERWRVYLLGGTPGAAEEAARRMQSRFGAVVVGADGARVSMDADPVSDGAILERIRAARPDLILVGLGAPKQERWIDRMAPQLAPAVAIGVGASIDFVAGRVRRAPAFVSRIGLEWCYRLALEPRRLWRRYLVRDPEFVLVVLRTMRLARERRVEDGPPAPPRPTRAVAPLRPATGGAPWNAETGGNAGRHPG